MARIRDKTYPEEDHAMWLGIAQFLGLLLMVMLFFLLAQSMVQHHFFTGGSQNDANATMGQ